jgi:hypothetical protein
MCIALVTDLLVRGATDRVFKRSLRQIVSCSLARAEQFGKCVVEELCRLKVDTEAEVLEIIPACIENSLEGKFNMPPTIKNIKNRIQPLWAATLFPLY